MSSGSSDTRRVVCFHGVNADVLTSNTEKNPSRRYYRCPYRNDKDCTYFEWLDEELPAFQKVRFLKMKSQSNLLEEQLKCKAIFESLLAEKLELKENEIIRLQNKNEELEEQLKCKAISESLLAEKLELKDNEIQRLQNKNEELEEQLKCKSISESLLVEKLELKDNEIQRLQKKNEELEKTIYAMCKRKKIERKLILLVLLFCVAMYCNGVGNGNENGNGRLILK